MWYQAKLCAFKQSLKAIGRKARSLSTRRLTKCSIRAIWEKKSINLPIETKAHSVATPRLIFKENPNETTTYQMLWTEGKGALSRAQPWWNAFIRGRRKRPNLSSLSVLLLKTRNTEQMKPKGRKWEVARLNTAINETENNHKGN